MRSEKDYLLRDYLTEADVEDLRGMRHDMNFHLRWGKILEECYPQMLLTMESILFGEDSPLVKKCPLDSLFPGIRAQLEDPEKGELRKQFLVLEFTRKLLGALKTKVNQDIADLPYLTEEQEEQLLEQGNLPAEPEEMDLLANPKFQLPVPNKALSEADEASEEVSAEGTSPRSNEVNLLSYLRRSRDGSVESAVCDHIRTTVSIRDQLRREYCKDCRQVISEGEYVPRKRGKRASACRHSQAEWVPGKEGKVARCAETGCRAPIEDPSRFTWEKVGLEPFGDDPAQDEVLVLNEVMQ